MTESRYGLNSFVHRTLAIRLLIGCSVIAIVFGMATYLTRYDAMGEDAITHAINAIERLKARVRSISSEPGTTLATAMQHALDEKPDHRVVSRYGSFVFARFYTKEGATLAQHAEPGELEPAQIETFKIASPLRFPTVDEPWSAALDIGGRPYIQIAMAIPDRNGALVAYGEGLYALSDSAITEARLAALKTAGYVVMIVLATSLLLYPVILTLTRRLANFSERLLIANLETMQVLGSAIAKRDSDTDAHNYRVSLYSIHIAEVGYSGAT